MIVDYSIPPLKVSPKVLRNNSGDFAGREYFITRNLYFVTGNL